MTWWVADGNGAGERLAHGLRRRRARAPISIWWPGDTKKVAARTTDRRRVAARLLSANSGSSIHQHEAFVSAYDLELERSRRSERPFSLSRFELVDEQRAIDRVAHTVARCVRSVDAVATIDHEIVVLWPETPARTAEAVVERLLERTERMIRPVRTVTFPDDGLTRSALWRSLFEPHSDERRDPPLVNGDGPVTSTGE